MSTSNAFKSREARMFAKTVEGVSMKPKSLKIEVKGIHSSRSVQKPEFQRSISVDYLRDAATSETSLRSRVMAIYLDCKHVYDRLHMMEKALILRLSVHHVDDLPYKTKTDCQVYLSNVIRKRFPILDDLKETMEYAQFVMDDIDRASWSLKLLLGTFELGTRPEMTTL